VTFSWTFPCAEKGGALWILGPGSLMANTLASPRRLHLFWCLLHDQLWIHCWNVCFLRFMSDHIGQIQEATWNIYKSTGWQWFRSKWIPMTTMKYGPRRYEVNVNTRANRMRICLSKSRETNDENLTGCLQIYVVLGYEKKRKDLLYTTNDKVL
jgi:hypothetical protein